jgi:hypothetical protein
VTRIVYGVAEVEIEAKDVLGYLYRRIMRQGYNDRNTTADPDWKGVSVVTRAYRVICNALGPSDPNLLPYLTAFQFDQDAHQQRSVPDYSKTAWEEIDELAATVGLDYTAIGRRIILWDTHRPIGRIGEMRDGDFSNPPVVTEYGMQLANYYAVTNNAGVFGDAVPLNPDTGKPINQPDRYYGPIELLSSAYGKDDKKQELAQQAQRNIGHRWPTPVVVRVPDNSTLSPESNVGFDQLVPGVWIPLRSEGTLREVTQWQKLDSVTVTFERGTERITVVMSPAPNGGVDPDREIAEAEEG